MTELKRYKPEFRSRGEEVSEVIVIDGKYDESALVEIDGIEHVLIRYKNKRKWMFSPSSYENEKRHPDQGPYDYKVAMTLLRLYGIKNLNDDSED